MKCRKWRVLFIFLFFCETLPGSNNIALDQPDCAWGCKQQRYRIDCFWAVAAQMPSWDIRRALRAPCSFSLSKENTKCLMKYTIQVNIYINTASVLKMNDKPEFWAFSLTYNLTGKLLKTTAQNPLSRNLCTGVHRFLLQPASVVGRPGGRWAA